MALRDGSTVHVRPVRASDEPFLAEFFAALSPESRAFRFFSAGASVKVCACIMLDDTYESRFGLVATRDDDDHFGQGTDVALGPGRAEVAFAVADDFQGAAWGRSCSPIWRRRPATTGSRPSGPRCYPPIAA